MTDRALRVSQTRQPAVTPDRWYVCPRANPLGELRLFFFPYAGGGPSAFTGWLDRIPDTAEAWFAHYPGRGSRFNEPLIGGVELLVENLQQAILPLIDKPFAFFGHSMGAVVAFELSRRLRRANLPQPQFLFVSAAGAPQIPDLRPPIHELPDSEFLEALKQLKGTPPEVLQHPELMQLLTPMLRADLTAIETYRFKPGEPPLDCPILAFGGSADPRVRRELLEGWADHTHSRFETVLFPGDHFFINSAGDSIMQRIAREFEYWLAGERRSI